MPSGLREQLVVPADLDDAAALEHDDRVGAPDRGQPVRDDERRAVHHQVRERLLHEQLRFGVERGGRLVEDQNRRVLQQRARDRDPLALAAREPLAALADRRVVAVRQRRDEVVRVGGARGRLDLLRASPAADP